MKYIFQLVLILTMHTEKIKILNCTEIPVYILVENTTDACKIQQMHENTTEIPVCWPTNFRNFMHVNHRNYHLYWEGNEEELPGDVSLKALCSLHGSLEHELVP